MQNCPMTLGVCGDRAKMRTRVACLPECLVDQSCLTLCDPLDLARQAPLSMGIHQARILEWVAVPSSRDLPNPGSNPGLPRCRWIIYHLSHQGSPFGHWKEELKERGLLVGVGTGWVLKVRERTVSGSDRTLFEGGERATEEESEGDGGGLGPEMVVR